MKKKKQQAVLVAALFLAAVLALLLFFWGRGDERSPVHPSQSDPAVETPFGSIDPGVYPTPAPTTGPFIYVPKSSTGPEEFVDYEYTGSNYENGAVYRNNNVLSLIYDDAGNTISVGLDKAEVSDGLYLNFQESTGSKMGYYISSTRNDVIINPLLKYESIDSEQNMPYSNFIINRTYDQLAPAEGENLCWANDILFDGKENTGTILNIRAINLSYGGTLVATFQAEISFENGEYRLKSLKSTDTAVTGEMSQEDHDALVTHALALVTNDFLDLDASARSDFQGYTPETVLACSKVEKVDNMYFAQVLTPPAGRMARSHRFSDKYNDIYAVTLSVDGGDSFTMYYSPDVDASLEELLLEDTKDLFPDGIPDGVILPDLSPVTEKGLRFFAFDLYSPDSVSVPAPTGYFN